MAKKTLVYIPYSRYKLSLLLAIRNCGFLKEYQCFQIRYINWINYTGGMPLIHNKYKYLNQAIEYIETINS